VTDRIVALAQLGSVIAGIGLLSYGARQVYEPAGAIVLGSLLFALGLVGVLRTRRGEDGT